MDGALASQVWKPHSCSICTITLAEGVCPLEPAVESERQRVLLLFSKHGVSQWFAGCCQRLCEG